MADLMIGFCPCCLQNRPSLPAPAEGTCAQCFNHLMIECKCTFAQRMVGDGCESCNPKYALDHEPEGSANA